jgi:hypothetical protein
LKIILILGARQHIGTDENVKKIQEQISEDRRYTINKNSEATAVSWSSCQRILTMDLNMKRVATKYVPHFTETEKSKTSVTKHTTPLC